MAFQKPIINKISTDLKDLTIYLRTTKKWGKSTLFRNVILSKYGDPSYGLAVNCGKEKGAKLLDNLNVTRIQTYKDAIELKDWLIKEKGKEHNIQIVSFDTVDELVPIFEKETLRISNIETPTKKVKTINAAMGGYQAGQGYTANDLIKPYMDELTEAGFGVWAISHTKFKTIKEKGGLEEDGYMQLTSNLVSAYEAAFGDIFDVTLTGVIDRAIEEKEKTEGGETKVKRYATGSVRKLYFRETPLIDAGGRFAFGAVPEYMIFDKEDMGAEFIRVVEEGMEKSKTIKGMKSTKASKISQPTKEIEKDLEEDIDDILDDTDNNSSDEKEVIESKYPDNLSEVIRVEFKNCKKQDLKVQIREIIKPYGKLADVDQIGLEKIYDILN